MKALVMAIVLAGFLGFWAFLVFRADMAARNELQAQAVAANYVMFRSAVFDHVFELDTAEAASILPDNPALLLPLGWVSLREWQGLLQREADGLWYCYVYGPASPEETEEVRKLLNYSMAVGWNDAGVLSRNGGNPWPLPSVIPHGNVVSVVRVD